MGIIYHNIRKDVTFPCREINAIFCEYHTRNVSLKILCVLNRSVTRFEKLPVRLGFRLGLLRLGLGNLGLQVFWALRLVEVKIVKGGSVSGNQRYLANITGRNHLSQDSVCFEQRYLSFREWLPVWVRLGVRLWLLGLGLWLLGLGLRLQVHMLSIHGVGSGRWTSGHVKRRYLKRKS